MSVMAFLFQGGICFGDEMKCIVPNITISERANISYTVRIG